MSVFQALVLGIVQGATEFLPVSSSAHLVLVPFVFGWPAPSVAFDLAVHLGTLISLLVVLWDRIVPLIGAVREPDPPNRRMLRLIVIGTIPAVVVGAALSHYVDKTFQRPVLVSLLLGVTGWVLFVGERHAERREDPPRGGDDLQDRDAAVVGVAQAIAILPGISRSGSGPTCGRRGTGSCRRAGSRSTSAPSSFLFANGSSSSR